MSTGNAGWTHRRILVALDASADSLSALEAAAGLAAGMRSRLAGLYVEDQDLLDLAALPFAREVMAGGARALDRKQLERDLKAQARAARAAMETVCKRAHVEWSFEVKRGRTGAVIETAAASADVIALGRAGRPDAVRLGSAARAAMRHAPTAVLLVGGRTWPGPVIVPFDGSQAALEALDTACAIVRADGQALRLVIDAPDDAAADALRVAAAGRLGEIKADYRIFIGPAARHMRRLLCEAEGGLIILPAGAPSFQDDARLARLLDQVRCPVLLLQPA